ncbi:MAG: DNA double-strand break repair nuclease NurA [Pyrinomonadaceae bacterium]
MASNARLLIHTSFNARATRIARFMLYQSLLKNELDERLADFVSFDRTWREDVHDYARRLHLLDGRAAREVCEAVAAYKEPGALPSRELDAHGSMLIPFRERWRTHEEARRWALKVLQERTTFAADGSQLLPGREISMPVAAVQVAWFENPHTRGGKYEKGARFHLVTPRELLEDYGERSSAETIVGLRRFMLETEALCKFLESKRNWQERGERTPVAFFDGSLLVSFGMPRTQIQSGYIDAVLRLVKQSRDTRVPVIGFVDQSYARDLLALLNLLDGRNRDTRPSSIYDAQLLRALMDNERGAANAWGARSSFCYCVREKLSDAFSDEEGKPLIGFTYLQTTGEGAPARLDVPVWIYEAGLLDDVVDAVRAECISGLGYPYAIETADEAAVITARDRQIFLRAIQEFAERENFAFRVSRKAASKMRRR